MIRKVTDKSKDNGSYVRYLEVTNYETVCQIFSNDQIGQMTIFQIFSNDQRGNNTVYQIFNID